MTDIVERLRSVQFLSDPDAYDACVQEAASEIERLRSHSPNPADHRYWEGRYRDEAAEVDRLKAEVERLRLALAAEREWQPIVTAPHDRDTPVLIWDGVSMWVACWVYDDQWQPEGQPSFAATHWMPLPQPPEKGT